MDNSINEINAKVRSSVHSHNKFSDWTEAELKRLSGEHISNETRFLSGQTFQSNDISNATTFSWIDQGAVTPVKDQKQCGSCWTFSATGVLEGAHFLATGELLSFSEQQFVDCATAAYDNYGCNGGLSANAFEYATTHTVELETDYPYTAVDGTCAYDESKGKITVTEWSWVYPRQSPDALKAALTLQPVSVSVDANCTAFHSYSSGVLTSEAGCGTSLDHAILAVGWGVEDGVDYWLVKNSWGSDWGEDGYIKIGIEDGVGVVGIQTRPVVATTN